MYNFSTGKKILGTMMIFSGNVTEICAWTHDKEKTIKIGMFEDLREEYLEPLAAELGISDLEQWEICWA